MTRGQGSGRLIDPPVARLRQRQRVDGSWRIWWEPERKVRDMGFETVELDAERPTWSRREAVRLNRIVAAQREGATSLPDRGTRRRRDVSALIAAYTGSVKFQAKLRPQTQVNYRMFFRIIEQKWGSSDVADFTTPILHEWYETLHRERGAHMALKLLRHFSILFAHARRPLGWIDVNPAADLDMEIPKPADRVLTWDEYDALTAAARDLGHHGMALAIAMGFELGQRVTDIREARLADIGDDGIWRFHQSKRGRAMAIPLPAHLRRAVAAVPRDPAGGGALILTTRGRAYTIGGFEQAFGRVRAHAAKAMPSCATVQFRDLRRSFGYWMRMGGAAPRDVADALGNSADTDPRLSQTYMPATDATVARAFAHLRRPGAPKAPGARKRGAR